MVTKKLKTLASQKAMVSRSSIKLSTPMVQEKTGNKMVKKVKKVQNLQVINLKLEKIAETFIEITKKEEMLIEKKALMMKLRMKVLRLLRIRMPKEDSKEELTSTKLSLEVTTMKKINSLLQNLPEFKIVQVLLLT